MKKYGLLCVAFLYVISSCTVDVVGPERKPDIDSIVISNKISDIIVGRQYQFEPTFFPSLAEEPESYTWFSSDTSVATIDPTGLLTAMDEGEVHIMLTSVVPRKNGVIELSDGMTITVLPVEIEQIRLNRDSLTIVNGSTATLTVVEFLPEDAKPGEVEWSSSNALVVTVVDGVVTAHSTGHAVITAKVKSSDIEATCKVTVNPIVLSRIDFDTQDPSKWDTLEIKTTRATQLIFTPDNAENKNVTYRSFQDSVATVNAVGVITGVSKGRATIRATSEVGGFITDYRVEVFTVPDLVTVWAQISYYDYYLAVGSLVFTGEVISSIVYNNSSEPVFLKHVRVLDNRNNIFGIGILINETLGPFQSRVEEKTIMFMGATEPRIEYTFDFEGREYKSSFPIRMP